MSEIVVGPFRGYWVAAYAAADAEREGQHLGYLKVCIERPDDYWTAECVAKDCTDRTYPSAEQALAGAIAQAQLQVGGLPPVDELFATDEARAPTSYESRWARRAWTLQSRTRRAGYDLRRQAANDDQSRATASSKPPPPGDRPVAA